MKIQTLLVAKRGFTIVEVLTACSVLSMILVISISIMLLINTTLYSGQTEIQNHLSLSNNIYFLTREIQSAEKITVSEKALRIKQLGSDDYRIIYTITNHSDGNSTGGITLGSLDFNDRKMLDLDYDKSSFSTDGNLVHIELALLKNNTDYRQIPKSISFNIAVRSEGGQVID